MKVNETGYDQWESKATSKGELQAGSATKVTQMYEAPLSDMDVLSSLVYFKYYGNIFLDFRFCSL